MEKQQFLKRMGQAAMLSPFFPYNLNEQSIILEEPYTVDGDEEF